MLPWLLLACVPQGTDDCRKPRGPRDAAFETTRYGEDWEVTADHDTPDWDFLWGARGVSIADFDGDGALDILVPREGYPTRMLTGRGDGRFVDTTEDAFPDGLNVEVLASSAADIDGDGDMDALLYGIRSNPVLLRNNGTGQFGTSVLEWWDFDGAGRGCGGVVSWADFDRDGDLDAFYGRLGGTDPLDQDSPVQCRSAVFRNAGTGELLADTSVTLPDIQGIRVVGAAWHDFDGDAWPDLYVITDRPPARNVFLRNREGLVFTAPRVRGLDIAVFGMGIGIADLNHDALPDITVPDILGLPTLLSLPEKDAWVDASDAMGLTLDRDRRQAVAWGGQYVDLDHDGREDLAITYGPAAAAERGFSAPNQPDEIYRQGDDMVFEPVGVAWGFDDPHVNRGVVAADLDRNGWMDLVTRELGGAVTVHMARCGVGAWLQVELRDEGAPNHHAVGATVVVHAGDDVQRRTVYGGGVSYSVSGPPSVHFGLGDAEQVDRVEVHWPDGTVTESGPHAARQFLTLTR